MAITMLSLSRFPRPVSQNAVVSRHTMSYSTFSTVSIPFTHLKDRNSDLSLKIEEGFGPNGLGILSVTDVPGYSSLRRDLLHLAPRLANLPKEVKEELEDPHSRYNNGWSHGKEKLESGKPDLLKGSFYANPILDTPTTETSLIQRYPAYCRSNIWPRSTLPELELAFKALGKLIFDVGLMLAYHCDQYVSKGMKIHKDEGLESIIHRSCCHKGRLLYYFPAQPGIPGDNSMSSWCGWHTDHGSLTGLTCGMFTKGEIPCPDSAAGLYIQTRINQIVKVVFGEDDIAYQIGEPLKYYLEAPKGEDSSGIERSTFALFMQPNWDEKLNFPEEVHLHKEVDHNIFLLDE
ncbi:Non-heme dioxygenase N-terminal domain [Sesbania bispinosa]|nr:Non-heme dioxygenase N-terminal domain [Sesbania bispinosa]